ncbi:hypothetical protein ACFLWG_00160 [Chloroflexota bacterium]
MKKVLIFIEHLLAVLVGMPLAFFFVFNAIFSDGTSIVERFFSFVLIIISYGILGLVFGFIWPKHSWRWGIWISITAFLIVGWYSFRETEHLPLHFSYLVVTAASACLAALAGTRLSAKRRQKWK